MDESVVEEIRQCRKCLQSKPLDEFPNGKTYRNGRRPDCRACACAYEKERKLWPRPRPPRVCLADRFWERVDVRGPDECWMWKRALDRDGYGRFSYKENGRTENSIASRLAWTLTHGPVSGEVCVCHSCDVRWPGREYRACCNPTHMFAASNDENMADMVAKGRSPHGVRNFNAKLTEADVLVMRDMRESGATLATIGVRFGVSGVLAGLVCRRKAWKHVG